MKVRQKEIEQLKKNEMDKNRMKINSLSEKNVNKQKMT